MSGPKRGSYARRTDIQVEPARLLVRRAVKPIPMDEVKDICDHCTRFLDGRLGKSLPQSADFDRRVLYVRKAQAKMRPANLTLLLMRDIAEAAINAGKLRKPAID